MTRLINLLMSPLTAALTDCGTGPAVLSQRAQVPENYEYCHPEQVHETGIDLNDNGEMDTYGNTLIPVEESAEDPLPEMTLDEKVSWIPKTPGQDKTKWTADYSIREWHPCFHACQFCPE
jgi:hypothetical protein